MIITYIKLMLESQLAILIKPLHMFSKHVNWNGTICWDRLMYMVFTD